MAEKQKTKKQAETVLTKKRLENEPKRTEKQDHLLCDEFAAGDGAQIVSFTLTAVECYHLIAMLKEHGYTSTNSGGLYDMCHTEDLYKVTDKLEKMAGDAIRPRLEAEGAQQRGLDWGYKQGLWAAGTTKRTK